MRKGLVFTGLLIAAVFTTAGCTKKQGNEYGLDVKETLRINLSQEPPSLDWSKSTDTTSSKIEVNIMDGLTEFDFSSPEIKVKPQLATEWKADAKSTVWTFKIRPNVTWTDGQPLTAQHFVDGWERLLNPLTASEYAYFLYNVKNAQAYSEGKVKDFNEVGVKAVDANTLQVTLGSPISYFPLLLTHHSTFPLRKDVVEKHGDKWTDPANIVTLGEYKLKTWDHDKALILERNDNYWGEKAKTKYVLAYMINEQSTAVNLFDSGKIDVLAELPSQDLPKLKTRPEYHTSGILSIYYYGFNIKVPGLDNLKVRTAFAKAINRQEVTTLLAGGQIPIKGWLPKGLMAYTEDTGLDFNVEEANKLMDEAGYKDRKKFPKLSISFNTNDNHQRVAENIQQQLRKNLGIEVELKNEEWKVYLGSLQAKQPQIFRMGWLADYPDPDNFLNLMTSYSKNNHTQWGNKKFDQYIEQAAMEKDPNKRKEAYSKAQNILTREDVAVFPIYSATIHHLVNKRVKNYPTNPMDQHLLAPVEVAAE